MNKYKFEDSTMLKEYVPLLFMILAIIGLMAFIIIVSSLVSRKRKTRGKGNTYECGMTPFGDARKPLSAKFFITAVLFILFDIESVFLIPWAINLKSLKSEMGTLLFFEMVVFVLLLAIGLIYVWKKGGLDWKK